MEGTLRPFPAAIQYSPLRDTDEVRLITLQPCLREGTICCAITHARLSDYPQFEALSYMWGPEIGSKSITVNDTVCQVRENLAAALWHLRSADVERLLWIDAICINQQDLRERNHQVMQMGKIYRKARRVVVWLGESDSESQMAMDFLSRTGVNLDWGFVSDASVVVGGATAIGNRQLSAIQSLCSRQYWQRLWIIQEVILAQDLLLQCGKDVLSWNNLAFLFRLIRVKHTGTMSDNIYFSREVIINQIQESRPARVCRDREVSLGMDHWSDILSPTLVELCLDYGSNECQDPRDKVFGLHAFAPDCCREAVAIDYSSTTSRIFSILLNHQIIYHAPKELSDIVTMVQNFYRVVGGSPEDYAEPLSLRHQMQTTSRSSSKGKVIGNIIGRISYASGFELHDASEPPLVCILDEMPVRKTPFKHPFQHVAGKRNKYHQYHPHPTERLDLTDAFPIKEEHNGTAVARELGFNEASSNIFGSHCATHERSLLETSSTHSSTSWVEFSGTRKCANCRSMTDTKLRAENPDLVCLAPDWAVDHLICQFSSDALVLVRKIGNQYRIVGGAINFIYSSLPKHHRDPESQQSVWGRYEASSCKVTFEVEATVLDMLTSS